MNDNASEEVIERCYNVTETLMPETDEKIKKVTLL